MQTATPGWYADPAQQGYLRFWDGSQWTEHRQPAPPAQQPAPSPYAPSGYGQQQFPPSPFGASQFAAQQQYRAAARTTPFGFVESVKRGFSKFADASGRATRAEYWWWALLQFLLVLPVYVVAGAGAAWSGTPGSGSADPSGAVLAVTLVLLVVLLVMIIPGITLLIRRLHDTGHSGWWILIGLVPFGSLVLLVFTLMDSDQGSNAYGMPST